MRDLYSAQMKALRLASASLLREKMIGERFLK